MSKANSSHSNILVCAATQQELNCFSNHKLSKKITGIGIPNTLKNLYTIKNIRQYHHIINIGIAGAYAHSNIQLGDIVLAQYEQYGDIGIEAANGDFNSIYQLGWSNTPYLKLNRYPTHFTTPNKHYQVHLAKGCTVNQCTGTTRIGSMRKQLGVKFESMEGAAVVEFAHSKNIPIWQIRSVSNFASNRNMKPQNIEIALKNLKHYLSQLVL